VRWLEAYLSHLALDQNVAASTHNVAFSALLFLCRDVLHIDLPAIEQVQRAQRAARLPEVFTAIGDNVFRRRSSAPSQSSPRCRAA
jgi:Phage integrase, N-terminal SAM-like domain